MIPAMTALMAVCAWITIPFAIPFTMQTFAVFLSLLLLGGKRSFVCFALYITLGAAGLPVFSSFGAGIGVLFGATGGFLLGFLLSAAVYWLVTSRRNPGNKIKLTACLFGIAIYHICGCLWYILIYSGNSTDITAAIITCTLPFVVPDIIKLVLAYTIYIRIDKILHIKAT